MPIPPSLGGGPRRSRFKSFGAVLPQTEGMNLARMHSSRGCRNCSMLGVVVRTCAPARGYMQQGQHVAEILQYCSGILSFQSSS